MASGSDPFLALIVGGEPYQNRVARVDLDWALSAAALDFKIEVHFLGNALLQLAEERNNNSARLPAGYRGWAALAELTDDARLFAMQSDIERCKRAGIRTILPIEALSAEQMRQRWRRCHHVLAL